MALSLDLVGQRCMDLFYQQYKSTNDFFDLGDFINFSGDTLGGYYLQKYDELKAEQRAERQEEVVTFSTSVLTEQILTVKEVDGVMTAKLEKPVMAFPFDEQSTGIQQVLPLLARDCQNLERSSINQIWQFKLLPDTDRIYWYTDIGEVKFWTNSQLSLKKVRVLYVPAVNKDMDVPDSLVDFITTNTVNKMKGLEKGTVIKKSLDQNDNKILETEINRAALKP